MPTHLLPMWTIYESPADHPGETIARRFNVYAGRAFATPEVLKGTLKQLRVIMQDKGLVYLGRDLDDDPTIVETWA